MGTRKEERNKLIQRQGGLSPLTGKPLEGKRLETHHIIERSNGGSNQKSNEQALSLAEHLGEHLGRKNKVKSEEAILKEIDIVLQRLNELTEEEKIELADVSVITVGTRVRFY